MFKITKNWRLTAGCKKYKTASVLWVQNVTTRGWQSQTFPVSLALYVAETLRPQLAIFVSKLKKDLWNTLEWTHPVSPSLSRFTRTKLWWCQSEANSVFPATWTEPDWRYTAWISFWFNTASLQYNRLHEQGFHSLRAPKILEVKVSIWSHLL